MQYETLSLLLILTCFNEFSFAIVSCMPTQPSTLIGTKNEYQQITTPAPHHSFSQARCSSWCPANNVWAL